MSRGGYLQLPEILAWEISLEDHEHGSGETVGANPRPLICLPGTIVIQLHWFCRQGIHLACVAAQWEQITAPMNIVHSKLFPICTDVLHTIYLALSGKHTVQSHCVLLYCKKKVDWCFMRVQMNFT